jgi:hypothetical protein
MQFRRPKTVLSALSALALAGAGIMAARGQGGAPAAPVGAAGSFEISGVKVDVSGKSADIARQGGWRIAQRKGWSMLSQQLTGKPGSLSDSALDAIVTGIVVEREQIGPNRYIASLGVQFDRAKAGSILGVSIAVTHSPPMLLVPLQYSGGVGQVFERDTAWARAWNRLRAAGSTIDYVRLRGTGADRLLVNAGQTLRHGRNWWRTILDQYGAVDTLVAEVQLRRDYPGGPIVGIFSAKHGPDGEAITSFALRIDNGDAIDALFDTAVARIDKAYQAALTDGRLHTDAVLAARPPVAQPVAPAPEETPLPTPLPRVESIPGAASTTTSLSLQVETPNAAAVNASESAVRGVPGVRSATTTSLALGGISVMRVSFDGSQAALRAALESRGWSVQEGPGVLRIRRAAAPQASPTPKAQ